MVKIGLDIYINFFNLRRKIMDLGLKEKIAIVTGGASNIGRGISQVLAAEGVKVVIADIDQKQAEKTVGDIKASGGNAIAIKVDLTKYSEVEAMVKKVMDQYKSVDILVNNVGWDAFAFFVDTTPESWDKVINLNYKTMLNCCRAVLPHMIGKKSGNIVSIASDAGRVGQPRESVYSGCKGAMIALTKTLARENGRFNIRVNVVSAGGTPPASNDAVGEFSMHQGRPSMPPPTPEQIKENQRTYPLSRTGTAEDIGNAVAFLVSDDRAGIITGQTLSVSRGYSMVG
jgi:2-hydroxycyclohexanecarboxyl-CoA dehydrogenase